MKKRLIAATAALALASAAAYAQMQHGPGMHGSPPAAGQHGPGMHGGKHGGMHGQMQGGMHGDKHGGHGSHGQSADVKGDTSPSSLAFHGVNMKMHKGMDIAFTGNADVDFVKGMIPHHEGAVDMAKVVLAFGKDAEIRALAESIIKAQETEIAQMKAWIAKNAR